MRAIILVFALILIINLASGKDKCLKDKSSIEPGRKCNKKCKKDKDCKKSKPCQCDDVCGMSCFSKDVECKAPPGIDSGTVIGGDYTYGSEIEYVCNDGYTLIGNSIRKCRSDKKWSGETPSCEPIPGDIECSSPQKIEGGFTLGNSNKIGATIEYICNAGYVLKGSKERTCKPNGKWSGNDPVCELGCTAPPRIGVSFSTHAEGIGFEVGTKVVYKCRFGYTLTGNPESECLADFTWSVPKFQCAKVHCGDPGAPENGYLEGNDFSFGGSVIYHCEKGFLIDNPKQVLRRCLTTGKWSGNPIACKKIKCDPPVNPENGFAAATDASFEFKTLVYYYCNPGFQLFGDANGECNEEGNWGPVPICSVDVNCNFDGTSNALCGYTNQGDGTWDRQFEQANTPTGNPSYVLRAFSTPAVFRSPSLISFEPHCFQFYYYIKEIWSDNSFVITSMNGKVEAGRIYKAERKTRWLNQQITIKPVEFFGGIQFDITLADDGTEIDLDDFALSQGECDTNCSPGTCMHGGTCINRIDSFKCLCTRYFKGRNCEIEITCSPIAQIEFGILNITPDPTVMRPDTVVKFGCVKGYRRVGPSQISCGLDGKWTNNKRPLCREIICDYPSPPSGGSVKVSSAVEGKLSIGSTIEFNCPIGRYFEGGHPVIVCGDEGSWSQNRRGSCEIQKRHSSSSDCPDGYRKIDMICYQEHRTWSAFFRAASTCASTGGSLAVVRSKEERERLNRIVKSRSSYHMSFHDLGKRKLHWWNGDNLIKISSESFSPSGMGARDDITSEPRCGYFITANDITDIFSSSCSIQRRFVCQAFPHSVQPIQIFHAHEILNGIYRPVMGMSFKGGLVYRKEGESGLSLFRKRNGWTIGKFDEKDTKPLFQEDYAGTISDAQLPQDIQEEWTFGWKMERSYETIPDIYIEAYDAWGPWSDWSACPVTCGGSFQVKNRDCEEKDGKAGYGDCKGKPAQTRPCNSKQCIETRWSVWREWSKCSKPCGGGSRTRTRRCIRDPEGNEFCDGEPEQTESCNEQECKPETSKWLKKGNLEYKIFGEETTRSEADETCMLENAELAAINNVVILNFLRRQINQVHCDSASAYSKWRLWVKDFHMIEVEGSAAMEDVKKADAGNDTIECDAVSHMCNIDELPVSSVNCDMNETSGYICERNWYPCNHNPCGDRGECVNMGDNYDCDCFEKYIGPNCEIEKRCGVEELKKTYFVSLEDTLEPVEGSSVAKDVKIRLDCVRADKGTIDRQTFTCIGLERWDFNKRIPEIKCENTCVLPKLKSKNLQAWHDSNEVQAGDVFPLDTLLTFSCPDLMAVVGEGSAECREEGWDVKLPTECEFTFPCERFPTPLHGQMSIIPVPKFQSDNLESGTRITLTCDHNYIAIGATKITCDKDGNWSEILGKCKEKQGCQLVLTRLSENVIPLMTGTFADVKQDTIFDVGQSVYLHCSLIETVKLFTCESGNTWSLDVETYC